MTKEKNQPLNVLLPSFLTPSSEVGANVSHFSPPLQDLWLVLKTLVMVSYELLDVCCSPQPIKVAISRHRWWNPVVCSVRVIAMAQFLHQSPPLLLRLRIKYCSCQWGQVTRTNTWQHHDLCPFQLTLFYFPLWFCDHGGNTRHKRLAHWRHCSLYLLLLFKGIV